MKDDKIFHIAKNSNPIETIIDFAWSAGADRFWVNNAKDELKKLKDNQYHDVVGWARINYRGEFFDLRLCYNEHINSDTVVRLYADKREFYEKYGKLSK